MDSRVTLNSNETFSEIVNEAYRKGDKVYLLVDDEGIGRMEGLIKEIILDKKISCIVLDNGLKILVNKIVAVNGIFLPEYGEC